ncbi:MAG: sulfate adenylyltransferase [Planctomycetaceae bacterium]|nr:sulfate adenylyltransferase [Planctomycetaceae bacterium]
MSLEIEGGDNSLQGANWQQAISLLRNGRGEGRRPIGELPPDVTPRDIADAMQLQEAVHQRLISDGHGAIVGTKIGCTTSVMQEYLGMDHPCSGAIFDSTVFFQNGQYAFDSFLHVGVECEIAVTLGDTIPVQSTPHTMQSIKTAVASVHAAIEIVDDRYVDFENRIPDWRTWVADDFFGAGAVLGEPVYDWEQIDLPAIRGKMHINNKEVGAGFGRDIINGHPLEALVWLANEQSALGYELSAGWIVMLGSVVQTQWLKKGDVVKVQLEQLGTAAATF